MAPIWAVPGLFLIIMPLLKRFYHGNMRTMARYLRIFGQSCFKILAWFCLDINRGSTRVPVYFFERHTFFLKIRKKGLKGTKNRPQAKRLDFSCNL